ncbi:ribonuclease H-like domain-containing protein [Tanacetum coccineum]
MTASSSQDEIPPPPPPLPSSQTPTQQTPHTVSTIKLPILKKGEYDIWAMKTEHYLAHTDYPIWVVIQNGNGPVSITTDTSGQIKVLPPRTAEEIIARERERKARTTLLMALPEDHLVKFHKMTDAKEMWDAIKSRFGGNDESKKMQKYILKQQFEGFSVSNTEGLHKGYDRFQSLLSQLKIHRAGVSTEDANQKFLRSLPSAWSQVSLIMRTKPGVDSLSFDDLYNNLRVFESDIKGSTASSSSSPQNIAFVSENTNSTNEVSIAYCVPNISGQNTKYEQTSSYPLLANQSSCPQLDHEDLEQIDEYDLEEMDLKWQVAMISMRMKKFYKKTGRKLQFDAKEAVGFDKTKVECYNCHKTSHFARECRFKGTQDNKRRDAWNSGNKDGSRTGQKEDSKALVTVDGEGVDWTTHSEDEDYALMACNSSDSDTKLVAHQQGKLWYEQKIKFMKIDLDDKTDVLTYHKKLLAEAQKEKEDLKAKVEKWHNSSKNLSKLLNTQMSANDKFGLGYGDHRYDGILSYENEMLQSVFMNKESEIENQPLYDRFVTAEGMHAVPPPMTGNYMPSGPDVEVDDSKFTYGPKQTQPSESESQSSEFDTCESNISAEPSELVSEPVVNESNVECQPKVWSDAPIIEEYESDSEDECVSKQETPSFANQQVKTPRENVKSQFTHSQKPKVDKKDLGHGFAVRACFVCGSLNHLIRDCDFHEKRMARKAELNNGWNNVQRVNKQNQFVPSAVLTRTGKIPVSTARASSTKNFSTARQSFNRQTVLTNTAMKVNTVKSIVNRVRPANVFHKTHSPSTRPFKKTTVLRTKFSNQKLNTAKDYPHRALKNKGIVDSGCFRHMTGNKAYLAEFQDFNGGPVAFGGSKGYITGGLACLIAKATTDDLTNDIGGKQHKASCKAKTVSSISHSLQLLHMDLFGPTSVRSLNHKTYCLVITDDFSRFSWVFFLRTKDETSAILKDFIRQIENQLNQKVKTIRSDNGTEFKNRDVIEFCGLKGIKREYSNARTPQQNGVAERKNRTLIEAARTMLADSFLPNTFWAEAVSTTCYVLNRVLVTKPHNKTPYELLMGKIPIISYIRPFGCHVTILNTIDHLHITFLENKPNVVGKGPTWLFDLDYLTDSMNYQPVRSENQANKHAGPQEANHNAGTEDIIDAGDSEKEDESAQDCFVLPIWFSYSSTITPDFKTDAKREGLKEEEKVFLDDDSSNSIHLYSNPNTDSDRMPLTKAKGLLTNCVENEFFKDFQDTSESSDDNTNVVNAPREPIVVNQDPSENSSPSPPHIDHCCHECGDSLDGIFCRTKCNMTTLRDLVDQVIKKKEEEKRIAEEQAAKDRSWEEFPFAGIYYGEDIDYVDASPPDVEITISLPVKIVECQCSISKIDSLRDLLLHLPKLSDLNHEEFADELAHIISPSEYDHFCFKIEPELGNLTMDVVNDIFPTREPRVHVPNVLPTHPTLDTDFILLSEPLFAYIVWIFLPFLTYPVAPPYLLSVGMRHIFDPGILHMYHSFMRDVSHRSELS